MSWTETVTLLLRLFLVGTALTVAREHRVPKSFLTRPTRTSMQDLFHDDKPEGPIRNRHDRMVVVAMFAMISFELARSLQNRARQRRGGSRPLGRAPVRQCSIMDISTFTDPASCFHSPILCPGIALTQASPRFGFLLGRWIPAYHRNAFVKYFDLVLTLWEFPFQTLPSRHFLLVQT